MNNKNMTRKLKELNWTNLNITQIEKNDRCMGQFVGYVRDETNNQYAIQLPEVIIDSGGIPAKQSKDGKVVYYKDERQRAYVKIPVNTDTKSGKEIFEKFTELDNMYNSDEGREKFFRTVKSKGYVYQPIVRMPQVLDPNDSDGEDTKKVYNKTPYIKVKFDFKDWENGIIGTKIFKKNNDNNDKKRTELEVTDLKSVEQYIRYNSGIIPVITIAKAYASAANMKDKTYGFILKLKLVTITTSSKNKINFETEQAFRSDDDEDDTKLSEDVRAITDEASSDENETHNVKDDSSISSEESQDEIEKVKPKGRKNTRVLKSTK